MRVADPSGDEDFLTRRAICRLPVRGVEADDARERLYSEDCPESPSSNQFYNNQQCLFS
jgi:hypothetical protein